MPMILPFDQIVWFIIDNCFINYLLNLIHFALLIEAKHFFFFTIQRWFLSEFIRKVIHRNELGIQLFVPKISTGLGLK